MPRAEIRPAFPSFLLNCEFHPVSLKVILFILFARFANHDPYSVSESTKRCLASMEHCSDPHFWPILVI